MAKKVNNNLERVSINLPSNIVSRVKEYAENLGINTTSAYIVLLNQALEQTDMLKQLPAMFGLLNEVKNLQHDTQLIQNNDDDTIISN